MTENYDGDVDRTQDRKLMCLFEKSALSFEKGAE